ncbi:hypothetical protein HSX11_23815 [Oxalobacteraceae bacterium]|nr:hypothetical protein [Oxalobacteraceae bacterium]
MSKRNTLAAALLLAAGFQASAAMAAARAALVLVEAPKARLAGIQIEELCASLATPCKPASTKAYVEKGGSDGPLHLIDSSRPMLVSVSLAGQRQVHAWDFSTYVHSVPPMADAGDAAGKLEIHPALYPVGVSDYAVALLSSVSESYSGGGARFDHADFLQLNREQKANYKFSVAYAAVPFFCSKTIRACFSEKEYKSSAHCSDESTGTLRIHYPDQDASAGWKFSWTQNEWAANVTKKQATTATVAFTIPPGPAATTPAVLPKNVEFCGEPQNSSR